MSPRLPNVRTQSGEAIMFEFRQLHDKLAGAEAELLALRPVVEAAVVWREWVSGAPGMHPIERTLVLAYDTYQRGLSGRAMFPIPSVCRCGHPESVHVTGGCSAPTGNHIYDTTCLCRGYRADAARASREPSE